METANDKLDSPALLIAIGREAPPNLKLTNYKYSCNVKFLFNVIKLLCKSFFNVNSCIHLLGNYY